MRRLLLAIALTAVGCAAQGAAPGPLSPNFRGQAQPTTIQHMHEMLVPVGTKVVLVLTRPVWAKTAKPGDTIYAETVFPVAIHNQMAIPAGTYAQGQIDSLSQPGWFSPHAEFQIHFTKIIFANGYTVAFPGPQNLSANQTPHQQAPAVAGDVIAAVADPYVEVSRANDILLDNGSQIDMVLQIPLALNSDNVADAVRRSTPVQFAQFKSATLCRPTSGTPGTSDTVIPGTPGTDGTPDTVIPGGPGMPDTVIPDIPATPGTPDTIIPGDPGTPGTSCPGPPLVTSNSKFQEHSESFLISVPMRVAGKQLPAGTYQLAWTGSWPLTHVDFSQNGNVIATAPARIVLLDRKSPSDQSTPRTNSDGSLSLQSLRFAGETFALYFNGNMD